MTLYATKDTYSPPVDEEIPDEDLLVLQKYLKRLRVWPEAGDAFLELLPQLGEQPGRPSRADFEWIPQVIQDCLTGIDIGHRYPAFFQKLLVDPDLRKAFLQKLERKFR